MIKNTTQIGTTKLIGQNEKLWEVTLHAEGKLITFNALAENEKDLRSDVADYISGFTSWKNENVTVYVGQLTLESSVMSA